jgi:hypothetical protein
VATEKGLFVDEAVTGAPWRGQIRRTRMVIYRWVESPYRDPIPEVLLKQVCDRLTAAMSGAGIQCQRQNGEQIHSWLLRWFNPEPTWVDKATLYRCARHTDDAPGELPLLNDFSESLWFTPPAVMRRKAYGGLMTWRTGRCRWLVCAAHPPRGT